MDTVVWWARPDAPPATDHLLTSVERTRLDALRRPEDQASFRSAHVLARALVASVTGAPIEQIVLWATCERCGGPHGAPRLTVSGVDGPHVTLSRCQEAVVAAVSPSRIGVDVEALGRGRAGLAEVALAPEEATQLDAVPPGERDDVLTRWWVRKEAVLKAAGTGLDVDPRSVVVTAPIDGVSLRDLSFGPGLAASLAVLTAGAAAVAVRRVELS